MFVLKAKTATLKPKFVLLVPCFVLLAACSSKQIQNAATEPLDLQESTMPTPEPEYTAQSDNSAPYFESESAPATVKKSKKSKKNKIAKKSKKKKKSAAAMGTVSQNNVLPPAPPAPETLPVIGDEALASAPINVAPMAPPMPFDYATDAGESQPNWLLIGAIMAGIVGLFGVAFRVRRKSAARKRTLVYNA